MMDTLTNKELLGLPPGHWRLHGLRRQRQYLLRRMLTPRPCPSCGTMQDYFQAAGLTLETYQFEAHPKETFRCIGCERELTDDLTIRGLSLWGLVPILPTRAAHVRQATELGAMLLLDKPLLMVCLPGCSPPSRLAKAADRVLADFDPANAESVERLSKAVADMARET